VAPTRRCVTEHSDKQMTTASQLTPKETDGQVLT
jgi:hypothetical protein